MSIPRLSILAVTAATLVSPGLGLSAQSPASCLRPPQPTLQLGLEDPIPPRVTGNHPVYLVITLFLLLLVHPAFERSPFSRLTLSVLFSLVVKQDDYLT